MRALNPLLILILILDKKMLGTIVLEFFFFFKATRETARMLYHFLCIYCVNRKGTRNKF